ncbi:helix-turn-helix domain-containing protein [Bacteroidales bacterium OttesenSCG-928-M06]|nr:helix-turn-helix domain-containing protein [Bacteroidales bacterium OttesenSCG-928-M06]
MFVIDIDKQFSIPDFSNEENVIEIILVTSGYLIFESNFNQIRINPQEVHLSTSQTPGYIAQTSDTLRGWYGRFSPESLTDNIQREDLVNEIEMLSSFLYQYPLRLPNKAFERLSFHMHSMSYLSRNSNRDIALINAYLLVCVFEIRKLMQENVLDFYPTKAFSTVKQYHDLLLKYIEQEQDISFYASLIKISPNHLNKSVRMVLGRTAISFLNEKRLLKAKSKLQFTDLSISEIALQLGFMDQSYFCRFFKKKTGESPLAYRKSINTNTLS